MTVSKRIRDRAHLGYERNLLTRIATGAALPRLLANRKMGMIRQSAGLATAPSWRKAARIVWSWGADTFAC